MRLLFDHHSKAGKDLQRKIEKIKQEGRDPSKPQQLSPPRPLPSFNQATFGGIPRPVPSPPPQHNIAGSSRKLGMTDSQGTVDESFMVLAGQRVSLCSVFF